MDLASIKLEQLESSDMRLTIGNFAFRALLLNTALLLKHQASHMPMIPYEYPDGGMWSGFGPQVGWTETGVANGFVRLFEVVFWSLFQLIEEGILEVFKPKELTLLKEGLTAYISWAEKQWGPEWYKHWGILTRQLDDVLQAVGY